MFLSLHSCSEPAATQVTCFLKTDASDYQSKGYLMPAAEQSSFDVVNYNFQFAANLLHLEPEFAFLLQNLDRELRVEVPITRDDGSLTVLRGFRMQHNY